MSFELPFDPPPVLPNFINQFETYLKSPVNLSVHNDISDIKLIKREINLDSLFDSDLSPSITNFQLCRDSNSGDVIDFEEILVDDPRQKTSDLSFSRPPGKITDEICGSSSNYPFWPGGIDPPESKQENINMKKYINFNTDYLEIVPGISKIFDLTKLTNEKTNELVEEDADDVIDLRTMIDVKELSIFSETNTVSSTIENELEKNVIPKEIKLPVLRISEAIKRKFNKTEYAELLDTTKSVLDFKEKVPEQAVNFTFELDAFQKLAIMRLERNEHIFVAAHTSAGKTVVAEYAIALSQKHCTKTIYTSPIKALSNQKYNDFQRKFEDVGLITGDSRVNTQASCLIMTTEILRSMLYGGSEVIRDIEFVIFDEVHYINDTERGHVWEEILIMLPDTVCIVMLSATVPNVLEFADWVGRTKKSKMYVVSTLKRPVPLQHYLYTGFDNQGQSLFLIQDAEGPFIVDGYNRAENSLSAKVKSKTYTRSSEKQYWISFTKYLRKYDRLPAVAFTLSRKKCDQNAEMLHDLDLTTQEEKSFIKYFYEKYIENLKIEDQQLPQILIMKKLLLKGIAKHHSGILPILKEIVEILFQKGLVRFLFATETFAMGVNMPAKSVAFDSIKKFDGTCVRVLLPAEYIQMAGRAGRRGQDEYGTVVILCKHEIAPRYAYESMMKGQQSNLESKFRITYSMILNLMRSKDIPVEKIMSKSFIELDSRKKEGQYHKELLKMQAEDLETSGGIKDNPIYSEMESFYDACEQFLKSWNEYSKSILTNNKVQKEMFPGRYIVITYKSHVNKLAIILRYHTKSTAVVEYKVLILGEENYSDEFPPEYYRMIGLSKNSLHTFSETKPKDVLINITNENIVAVTTYHYKTDFEMIIKNCEQRQLPRFKNDPPSSSCERLIQELMKFNRIIQDSGGLMSKYMYNWYDFKISNLQVNDMLNVILRDKKIAESFKLAEKIPDFESFFKEVFIVKQKESRKKHLQYLLSDESLKLYSEYLHKVEVLKHLDYIDFDHMIKLKGKVACEMGTHELLVTELIFRNTLSKFDAKEIAALLSCLVFQVKADCDLETILPEKLIEGMCEIKSIQAEITAIEQGDNSFDLNFALVLGVYDWASGKSFSEIMSYYEMITQEGIIVRCIQQLYEILCDIKDAVRIFGDLVLKKKMEEACEAIKRDIVFAPSLYTTIGS